MFLDLSKNLWNSSSPLNVDSLFNVMLDDFVVLEDVDRVDSIRPISKREVYQTLKFMPPGKSPGPDGLNVVFYIFYWNLIRDHFLKAITYFFNTCNLPSSWVKTFVTLIPKKYNPLFVSDFHPISLCNVCYKVISKTLSNRLKRVMHKLIEPEQTGFLSSCGSFDNVIVAQEIAHSLEFDFPTP